MKLDDYTAKLSEYATPQELKTLGQAFLTILAAIALTTVFLMIVVPGLRSKAKPVVDVPTMGATGWLDPTEYPPTPGYDVPPIDPKTVLTPTPELQAQGQALFQTRCTSCHGATGQGDGPAGRTLNPIPRDLTRSQGWKNGPTLSGIFKTLSEGLPNTQMAP
ncbi:MAG: c-type cytochrome, partial [Elusimicrobiota bacterium]